MTGDDATLELRGRHAPLRQRDGARGRLAHDRATASSSRCSARPAAGRRRSCASSPASSEPSEGRLVLQGRDVTRVPPHRRPVNMVFQRATLFPHLDVFENVAFGLRVAGIDKAETYRPGSTEALSLVRLDGFERRRAHELSGGQMQRVALARALVNRPRVLLARRAALGARPADPARDGGRAPSRAPRDRRDVRLRHARPGRGARALRPDRRLRPAAGSSRSGRRTRSTAAPALAVRRPLRRRRERASRSRSSRRTARGRPVGIGGTSWSPRATAISADGPGLARRPARGRSARRPDAAARSAASCSTSRFRGSGFTCRVEVEGLAEPLKAELPAESGAPPVPRQRGRNRVGTSASVCLLAARPPE